MAENPVEKELLVQLRDRVEKLKTSIDYKTAQARMDEMYVNLDTDPVENGFLGIEEKVAQAQNLRNELSKDLLRPAHRNVRAWKKLTSEVAKLHKKAREDALMTVPEDKKKNLTMIDAWVNGVIPDFVSLLDDVNSSVEMAKSWFDEIMGINNNLMDTYKSLTTQIELLRQEIQIGTLNPGDVERLKRRG